MAMYLGASKYLININSFQLSDTLFAQFCSDNRDLRLERDPDGNLLIGPPKDLGTGSISSLISLQITNWNYQNRLGTVFSSNSGFTLADSSIRSATISWVSKEKWDKLSDAQHRSFAPVCPEFVIELKSATDLIDQLQKKMEEVWIKNGSQLGLLIDPDTETTHVYRKGQSVEVLEGFDRKVPCDPVLKGFELNLDLLKSL